MSRLKWLFVFALLISLPGCTAGCQNQIKHATSDIFGLNRKITLYDANGGVIREWETKAKVEDQGGTCYFLTNEGKAVIVSGTFIVEEH